MQVCEYEYVIGFDRYGHTDSDIVIPIYSKPIPIPILASRIHTDTDTDISFGIQIKTDTDTDNRYKPISYRYMHTDIKDNRYGYRYETDI